MHRTEVTENYEMIPMQEQNKESFTEDILREHDKETCEEMKEEMDHPGIECYNLSARKPCDYSHLHATMKGALQRLHECQCPQQPCDYSHVHITSEDTVMTQYSMKKGIQEFGEARVEAVLKELQQLHDRKVLEPRQPETMSHDEKQAALHYLMFLTNKRCGHIKGRGCAHGCKQRAHMSK